MENKINQRDKNNKKIGFWREQLLNEYYYECFYVGGKREGLFKTFYKAGQLRSIYNTIDDKAEGEFLYYDQNGCLLESREYNKNSLNGYYKKYYKNGKLKEIGFYKNDGLIGELKQFYENGNLSSISDGKYLTFYSNTGILNRNTCKQNK